MKFGLTAAEFRELEENLLRPLKQLGVRVWVFGSRARGDHKPFSDLDVMVESPVDISGRLSDIREHFTEGNFPYKIDLVELKDFAESYKAGFLKDRVEL